MMIEAKGLSKTYTMGRNVKVNALIDTSFNIERGKIVTVVGPSGSGKSTLLNILGGLDNDYSGILKVDGKDLKEYESNSYRRMVVGTIFQQFNLVPSLSVSENILLPLSFSNKLSTYEAQNRLDHLLERLGLSDRAKHLPSELSGGQSQRVAIARALISKPKIILADEPTGNLDSKTGNEIVEILFNLNKEEGTTLIIVTHDPDLFKGVDKLIKLKDGRVEEEKDV